MDDQTNDFYQEYIKNIPIPQYIDVEIIFNKIYYDFILSIYNSHLTNKQLKSDKISNQYFFQYPYVLKNFEFIDIEDDDGDNEYKIESIFDNFDIDSTSVDIESLYKLIDRPDIPTADQLIDLDKKDNKTTLHDVLLLDNYYNRLFLILGYIEKKNEQTLEKLDDNYSIIANILYLLDSLKNHDSK